MGCFLVCKIRENLKEDQGFRSMVISDNLSYGCHSSLLGLQKHLWNISVNFFVESWSTWKLIAVLRLFFLKLVSPLKCSTTYMTASVLGSVEEQPEGQHLCVSLAIVKLLIVAKTGNPVLSYPLQLVPFAPVSSLLFALFNGFWGFRISLLSEFL